MIGIGHKLEAETKRKIMAERAREHNAKYDNLVKEGVEPEQATKVLKQ